MGRLYELSDIKISRLFFETSKELPEVPNEDFEKLEADAIIRKRHVRITSDVETLLALRSAANVIAELNSSIVAPALAYYASTLKTRIHFQMLSLLEINEPFSDYKSGVAAWPKEIISVGYDDKDALERAELLVPNLNKETVARSDQIIYSLTPHLRSITPEQVEDYKRKTIHKLWRYKTRMGL